MSGRTEPIREAAGGIGARMALEMRRQYAVGFYPTAATGKAGPHKIRIRVSPRDGTGRLRLSYRAGYWPRSN